MSGSDSEKSRNSGSRRDLRMFDPDGSEHDSPRDLSRDEGVNPWDFEGKRRLLEEQKKLELAAEAERRVRRQESLDSSGSSDHQPRERKRSERKKRDSPKKDVKGGETGNASEAAHIPTGQRLVRQARRAKAMPPVYGLWLLQIRNVANPKLLRCHL